MATAKGLRRRPLGAVPRADGGCDVRVWAPRAHSVAVRFGALEIALDPADDGYWEGEAPLRAGEEYFLVLDDEDAWPDPCSRAQPHGVRGASAIVDPGAFPWSDEDWHAPSLDELVLYELHVGTFSEEGTFVGVVPRLAGLRELGVTAIELMPVATFPGNRGWGYDGLYTSAPHPAYGGPIGLATLVDAAHAEGLAVFLDVVYNHLGPGNEAITAFGPYFRDDVETPWGAALDFGEEAVREWAIQNAELWVADYHVDGLRLDAAFAVHDEREPHVLEELADRVRTVNPRALVIAEMDVGNRRAIDEWGHDAQWADDFHHELHVLLTGERHGYYGDYRGSLDDLARLVERTPAERYVYASQNHDQVGNRAAGDRPARDELRLRAALTVFAPQIPLLFMGEEYGEQRPFQFFTDHIDPSIADATREGRRREFGFAGEVPDPQAEETFLRSKLDRDGGDDELRAFYRELLALHRGLPRDVSTSVDGDVLRVRRGDRELVADFGARTVELR